MSEGLGGCWIGTSSGMSIDVLNPQPESFRLVDMAISLSRIPRFNGHTVPHASWSVAEHSLLVEQLAPLEVDAKPRLHLLLHDAHEMVIGDTSTPVKNAYNHIIRSELGTFFDPVKRIQIRLQRAIELALLLPPPDEDEYALIKELDLLALAIEKRDVMVPMGWGWPLPDVSKVALQVSPDNPVRVRKQFRERVLHLMKEAGVTPMPSFLAGCPK